MKYILLSGFGWLVDFFIFTILAVVFKFQPAISNILSATFAALLVFLLTRLLIFKVSEIFIFCDIFIYFIYTEINILFWSYAIEILAIMLTTYLFNIDLSISSLIAKVAITPLSLSLNYTISKYLSRK